MFEGLEKEKKYNEVWHEAMLCLQRGVRKDFVLHTKGVVKAMRCLLEKEGGNEEVLIISAILHDVGWSKVPMELQRSNEDWGREEAMKLHIEYAPEVIREILESLDFENEKIEKVIEIVSAHKFQDPEEFEKKMLIDADNLADVFADQLESDAKMYEKSLSEMLGFRKDNKFYFDSARKIFEREVKDRMKEID